MGIVQAEQVTLMGSRQAACKLSESMQATACMVCGVKSIRLSGPNRLIVENYRLFLAADIDLTAGHHL